MEIGEEVRLKPRYYDHMEKPMRAIIAKIEGDIVYLREPKVSGLSGFLKTTIEQVYDIERHQDRESPVQH